MKNKLLIFLLLLSIGVQAQTPNNSPTRFTAGLGAPITSTAPFASQGFLWWQPSATLKLAVYNGAVWQNLLTETLAGTTYAPLASPAFTGVPTAPTATLGTNTTQLATTAFTAAGLALKQNLLSGTGFVKSTAGTISYDNSTYYLASNPNGYTSNTGTVMSFGKVDGYGITSSVANPTTTPVHTVAVDTTTIMPKVNAFTKAQADVRYLKLSPFASAQTIDGQVTINNSLFAFGRTTTYGLQTLVSSVTGATTLTANQHTISATGTYNISLPTGIANAGQQYTIKNNGSGVITLIPTGGGETIDGASSYAINAGEAVSIAGNYSAGWTKVSFYTDNRPAQLVEVSGTTQQLAGGTTYIFHNTSTTQTANLPTTNPAIGSLITIIMDGVGRLKITQNASQFIASGGTNSTTGTSGYIQTNTDNATVTLRYLNTNKWSITSSNSTPVIF